jgi:hypothetical protein
MLDFSTSFYAELILQPAWGMEISAAHFLPAHAGVRKRSATRQGCKSFSARTKLEINNLKIFVD